jgi:hypothetical protein
MDQRILLAAVAGLLLAAFGGFYIGLSPRFDEAVTPPSPPLPVAAMAPPAETPASPPAAVPAVAAPLAPSADAPQTADAPASADPPTASLAPAPPPQATPAAIEAKLASSEYAELQALLKARFPDEYAALIAFAVRRKDEGAAEQQLGQEMFARIQGMLRAKLKFGTAASMATIDKLAGNEKALFHALATTGSRFCLKMLGKDDSPADAPPPEDVRRLMSLGTLYRFQAIVEGMPSPKPVEPLKPEEMKAFETALGAEGLDFESVSNGAYLNEAGGNPGKPCLTLEKLHRAIATLPDVTRRKVYAGMFFLGREN